jgi:hypothetical protein
MYVVGVAAAPSGASPSPPHAAMASSRAGSEASLREDRDVGMLYMKLGTEEAAPKMAGGVAAGQSRAAVDRACWSSDIPPMWIRTRSSALLGLALLLAACEEENTLNPALVTTTQLSDLFSYGVVGLENVSDADRYLWLMTGDQATVDVSPALSGGSAFLQIRSGDGEIVYAENIGDEVDGVTDVGFSGIWQIDIIFDKASGGFGFELERDTIPATP